MAVGCLKLGISLYGITVASEIRSTSLPSPLPSMIPVAVSKSNPLTFDFMYLAVSSNLMIRSSMICVVSLFVSGFIVSVSVEEVYEFLYFSSLFIFFAFFGYSQLLLELLKCGLLWCLNL